MLDASVHIQCLDVCVKEYVSLKTLQESATFYNGAWRILFPSYW